MSALILLSEEGPNTSLVWLLLLALGFFFLMVIVGWLVSRNQPAAPVEEASHGHDAHGHDDHAHAAPAAKVADDLKSLEGIGPKVEQVLNAAGIHSFADLAGADNAAVKEVLVAAGLQYMEPAGWIAQAKLAAAGDMDGLAKLQEELKGGRMK